MKHFTLIFLALFSLNNVFAGGLHGKYRVVERTGYGDGSETVFLLRDSGALRIIDNEYFYEIDSYRFDSSMSLSFESGGDEDYYIASMRIELEEGKTVLSSGCSALVDAKNEFILATGDDIYLEKWNPNTKNFEKVPEVSTGADQRNCEVELFEDYLDRGFTIDV